MRMEYQPPTQHARNSKVIVNITTKTVNAQHRLDLAAQSFKAINQQSWRSGMDKQTGQTDKRTSWLLNTFPQNQSRLQRYK